ncbi:MAG TPA: M28 family peptidase [Gemmatimonadales bacterium]|jgi:hypothetical protein
MRSFLILAAIFAPLAGAAAQEPAPIDSMALRAHTYFLSHDLLEGRGTGTRGAEIAARYLATSAERLHLLPAGPNGTWLQDVPLVEAVIDTAGTTLTIRDSTGSVVLRTPGDFIPNAGTARTLTGFAGGLAWIGAAADVLAHPDRLPPLAGRVVIMAGSFGADMAAADTLRARGATGVIHFVGDDDTYHLYVDSRGDSRIYVADSTVVSSFDPDIPGIIARSDVIRRLMPPGTTQDKLERPFLIGNRRIEVTLRTRSHPIPGHNVAAMLPGTDARLKNEYVVYTAHYDHLGVEKPDASGDSIFNGFSDNAAGCAMLLALAEYFGAHRPQRSMLFLWFTGEERGLLGSDYYVAHPFVPLSQVAGVINLDAGAPPARPVQWHISGAGRSSLGDAAIAVARQAGWDGSASAASPNTDYYPFLRLGVPAVFLVPGPGAYQGLTTDSSQALRRRWDHYHQAADNWAADFPFEGLVRYADFARLLGMRISSGPRPVMVR